MRQAQLKAQTEQILRGLHIDPAVIAHRTLPYFEDVSEHLLVETETDADTGRIYRLTAPASAAWHTMKQHAAADGVAIYLVSAYRSLSYQADLIRTKQQAGIAPEVFFTSLAPPGCSEHHTGCAVDINTPGCDEVTGVFGETAAFTWLQNNAARFGFVMSFPQGNPWGFIYEPWHWCWHSNS
ncbi:M15 family metallopeptidase [Rahnella aquatilis]|uniref:M15 family metallopeptidase n=1 Tax=Rahnella perminowiae TaxID=2816244 RepID=UPI001F3350A0|nr:M15 family metallopeptidase [Rahnella perminowiae]MCR9002911.1 M15 family metallopeptidase [Rahnella perminowiae]UJD88040.1 M15 family metallopeptidase [Rahnella aquatilis]